MRGVERTRAMAIVLSAVACMTVPLTVTRFSVLHSRALWHSLSRLDSDFLLSLAAGFRLAVQGRGHCQQDEG